VRAGLGVADRRAHELFDGGVIGDVVPIDDAAVAVRCVLAEAHVRDHDHVGHGVANRANRGMQRSVEIVRPAADLVLCIRKAKQQHGRHAFGERLARLVHGLVGRELMHARHRPHRAAHAVAAAHEQRQYQLIDRQPRLTHHATQRGRAPQPSHPQRNLEPRRLRLDCLPRLHYLPRLHGLPRLYVYLPFDHGSTCAPKCSTSASTNPAIVDEEGVTCAWMP
jgi:hypothetical protein